MPGENFQKHDCCLNCHHVKRVYVEGPPLAGPRYYCGVNIPKPPTFAYDTLNNHDAERFMDEVRAWRRKAQVPPHGTCDSYIAHPEHEKDPQRRPKS